MSFFLIWLMFSSILKLRSISVLQYLLDPMVGVSISIPFQDNGNPCSCKPSPDGDSISVTSSLAVPHRIMICNNKTGELHHFPQSQCEQEVKVDGDNGFSFHDIGDAATSIWSQQFFN